MAISRHASARPAIATDFYVGAACGALGAGLLSLTVLAGWVWAAASVLILFGAAAALSCLVAEEGRDLPRGDGAPPVADTPPWGPA